ncbi:hypothetical protein PI125_g2810 [Phytophthora idaei]|nr:hypothetical protein PI125_g2810 [Phytophthora idaei]KAG3169776.1 hypothetical protein PI126_g2619 [Phytophthora idaei]
MTTISASPGLRVVNSMTQAPITTEANIESQNNHPAIVYGGGDE